MVVIRVVRNGAANFIWFMNDREAGIGVKGGLGDLVPSPHLLDQVPSLQHRPQLMKENRRGAQVNAVGRRRLDQLSRRTTSHQGRYHDIGIKNEPQLHEFAAPHGPL